MEEKKRFSGKMGEEYHLLRKAYPKYDHLHQVLADVISDHFKGQAGDTVRILEAGCGSGITAEYILSAGDSLFLESLDSEAKMIDQARANLGGAIREGRLRLVEADALEFLQSGEDDSYEAFASGFTLHNFTGLYRRQVLLEVFRVLRPGGLFVNADKYSLDGQENFDELVRQLDRFFEAFVPLGKIDLLREWVLHNVADQAPDRVMREKEAVMEMEEIGFEEIRVHFRHGLEAVVSGKKKSV